MSRGVRYSLVAAVAALLAFVPACGKKSGKIKIGVVTNCTAEFWSICEAGAKKAAAEFDVDLVFRQPTNSSVPDQMEIVEGFMQQGVKGLAVSVIDPKEQTPELSPAALLGRVRFNDQCSHCHGADGASPIRERDVRRLKMRYDAKWVETATATIKNGRADQGMPPWKDMLKEPEIQQLLSFLETVQK